LNSAVQSKTLFTELLISLHMVCAKLVKVNTETSGNWVSLSSILFRCLFIASCG